VKVLVATSDLAVFDVFQGVEGIEYKEALFTGGLYDELPGAQLVIVDFDELVPHPYSIEMVRDLLENSEVPYVPSKQFLEEPDRWIMEARRVRGEITGLPSKRTIAFTSYSGGTGKTILSVDTALHFARRTKLPALLTEFTYGESAIAALIGKDVPHLFDLSTQPDIEPATWKGITVVPMDYEHCRDLSVQLIGRYLKEQSARHVLTVADVHYPHALLSAIREDIDQWYIVTTPRPDAIENARKLKEELGRRAGIVLNQKGTLDSIALSGIERALDLPNVGQADRFEGKLGKPILAQTYGEQNWRQYEPNLATRISRALGFSRNSHQRS
jgi:Mrp family chromosome partitioning ATPase